MSIVIEYEVPCNNCGGFLTRRCLYAGQPEGDGAVHIDIRVAVDQMELSCECGAEAFAQLDIEQVAPEGVL